MGPRETALARLSFFAAGLLLQLHLEDIDEVVHVLLLLLDRLLQRLEVRPDVFDFALVVLQCLWTRLVQNARVLAKTHQRERNGMTRETESRCENGWSARTFLT